VRTMIRRLVLIILCLAVPCAAMAQSEDAADAVVHAAFTMGLGLHADGFPTANQHLADWEKFLDTLTLTGSLDGRNILKPDSRVFMQTALCLDGEEIIPFTFDNYGRERYMISPMLRDEPVLFYMYSYIEFMMKFYFYLGLPSNYIALLTYPDALWDILNGYATPVADAMTSAHAAALEAQGDDAPETLTYTIPYADMLALCNALNAMVTEDTRYKRVRWFLDALLADLYVSEAVLETATQFDLLLMALDPEMQGMTVTETAEVMTCTIGGQEIFAKSVSGGETEINFRLPMADGALVSFSYQGETHGDAVQVSAKFAVTAGEDTLFWATVDGDGLPAQGALGGEGQLSFAVGGSVVGDEPPAQAVSFAWSCTADELPYDLNVTLNWLHPQTGNPAASLYLSAAVQASDASVFVDQAYPMDHFFGLNPDKLLEYKERWTNSIIAYLTPLALSMPVGVMDDVVSFLLDSDLLLSITE